VNGFDLKYLTRAITLSQTYQRSSKPSGNNGDAGPELFARMAVKPLTPGQLYDSLTLLVGAPGNRPARRQGPRVRITPREVFVTSLPAPPAAAPTKSRPAPPQVRRRITPPQLNNARLLGPIMRDSKTQAEQVEKLYLTVLARRPRSEEIERINTFLANK